MVPLFSLLLSVGYAFTITFRNYLTDPNVPQADFYLVMDGKSPVKVASATTYKSITTVDVTTTLNDLAGGTYTATTPFNIQLRPTTAIPAGATNYAKYSSDGILATKILPSGFATETVGVLWVAQGNYETTAQFLMTWTEDFQGTKGCNVNSTYTDCFVINIKAQKSSDGNNDKISFDTIADNNEDFNPGETGYRRCKVGRETIRIKNQGVTTEFNPTFACGDKAMYIFYGDRMNQNSYPLAVEGSQLSGAGLSRWVHFPLLLSLLASCLWALS